MTKTLYTKFSSERKSEFQIMTRIIEKNSKKCVTKTALYEEGRAHVKRMCDTYSRLNGKYSYPGLKICPCTYDEKKGEAEIPFIKGESLESRITRHGKKEQFAEMKADYQVLYDILCSVKDEKIFEADELFHEIFGFPTLPAAVKSTDFANVDMLPSNLLIEENQIWLVDYEWVFPCSVPHNYIFARSIFLQEEASKLPAGKQAELYAIADISLEDVPAYYEMEVHFQEYVEGKERKNNLGVFYESLKRKNYLIKLWDKEKLFYPLSLCEAEGEKRQLLLENCVNLSGEKVFRLSGVEAQKRLCFSVTDGEVVLKIRAFRGRRNGELFDIPFEHNAACVIYDDYYFTEKPEIVFVNDDYDSIEVDYMIYWKEAGVASALAKNILQSQETLVALQGELNQTREELCKVNEKAVKAQEELERMRNRKVVKAADAAREVLKKE